VGVLAALLSACTSTGKDLVSKLLAGRVHPDVSTFASFFFALPFYLIVMVLAVFSGGETLHVTGAFLSLVFIRGLSDVCAEGCKMRALAHGDVSLVTGLLALSPLLLTILSPLITGDPVSLKEGIAIGFVVAGSFLLIRRDKKSGGIVQPVAVLYAVGGSLAFALNSCFDRLAVEHGGPLLSAFAMTLCASVLTSAFVARRAGSLGEMKLNVRAFLLRGLFETIFMVAKMIALVTLPAHVVVGIMRMSLLLTVVVGGAMFKEQDRVRRIIASAIMCAGLVLLVM
jgi:drug/metabolite transporter (DMT)-like permease